MNAKEYLSQAFMLDQRINSKLKQVDALRDLANRITANIDSERVDGSKQRSPMENVMVKIIDYENEINDDIDKLVDLKLELSEFVMQVSQDTSKLLLELRYLSGNTWEEVSDIMGYDLRWIYRLHGKALKEADQILKGKYNHSGALLRS